MSKESRIDALMTQRVNDRKQAQSDKLTSTGKYETTSVRNDVEKVDIKEIYYITPSGEKGWCVEVAYRDIDLGVTRYRRIHVAGPNPELFETPWSTQQGGN